MTHRHLTRGAAALLCAALLWCNAEAQIRIGQTAGFTGTVAAGVLAEGAMLLHIPVNPWLFNVGATCQREAEHAVHHLSTIGIDRIIIIHVDDSFGADCVAGANKGFRVASKSASARTTTLA